jgi:hypothetical protein
MSYSKAFIISALGFRKILLVNRWWLSSNSNLRACISRQFSPVLLMMGEIELTVLRLDSDYQRGGQKPLKLHKPKLLELV